MWAMLLWCSIVWPHFSFHSQRIKESHDDFLKYNGENWTIVSLYTLQFCANENAKHLTCTDFTQKNDGKAFREIKEKLML